MAKGRKKAEPVDETEEDTEQEDAGDGFDADLDDDDDDGGNSDEVVAVDLMLKSGTAPAQSARRRVEDYLEMKRAARQLSDIEDFDLD